MAAVVAAMARAAEATERERATFAAAEAAEAAATAAFTFRGRQMAVVEREAAQRDTAIAAGRAWRAWAADRAAAAKAAAETADAERKLEAARNALVAAEGRAHAERELARG
jgi:hypothetical protein